MQSLLLGMLAQTVENAIMCGLTIVQNRNTIVYLEPTGALKETHLPPLSCPRCFVGRRHNAS